MNNRHREQLSTAFVSKTMSLVRFLLDKSQQSRKITQWCFIDPILREARSLFVNICDLLDGMDSKGKALRNIYNVQKQSVLVRFLEQDGRRKKVQGKVKKHYGFDLNACACIDEMCDELIAQVCAYGQSHQPYNRG